MKYLIIVFSAYILMDVYYRLISYRRSIHLLLLLNDTMNLALVKKGIIKKEELSKSRSEVLKKLPPKMYKQAKKDLIKLGIDIDN